MHPMQWTYGGNAPMTLRILLILCLTSSLSAAQLTNGPHTQANDDSCDIGIAPAATLLLPYFEVDVDSVVEENTLFTITNTGGAAQVARVTLWTDHAYPVLTFDIYLTGYDVQAISLYDVISRGVIGGTQGTGVSVSPAGEHSVANPLLDASNCGDLPRQLGEPLVQQLKQALIDGEASGCDVGYAHENAVGYATIDVVGNCAPGRGPLDPKYFSEDIRYDNVLIGDYIRLNRSDNFAQASPMVHIRAVPAGGTQATRIPELPGPLQRLERTFYGRLQDPERPHLDARQPLPSTFGARWINGGQGAFNTTLQIWREGVTGRTAACSDYERNGRIEVLESVAFDEDENGYGSIYSIIPFPGPYLDTIVLPATSNIAAGDDDVFPQESFDDGVSGWIYLNLDDGKDDDGRGANQNWVTVTMRAEGRYSTGLEAAMLGNGCSSAVALTDFTEADSTILPGPAEDVNP
jgi:hypothetical protein